jgi:hypothetical protein
LRSPACSALAKLTATELWAVCGVAEATCLKAGTDELPGDVVAVVVVVPGVVVVVSEGVVVLVVLGDVVVVLGDVEGGEGSGTSGEILKATAWATQLAGSPIVEAE